MGFGEIIGNTSLLYMRMDDETNIGSGGAAIGNNNSVTFPQGKFGNSAYFGDANTNKSLSAATDLSITGGNITMSAWVKVRKTGSSNQVVCRQVDAGTDVGYYFQINENTNTIQFIRQKMPSTFNVNFSAGLVTVYNKWHHILGTYDGTNLKMYINGSLIDSDAYSGNGTSGGTDSFIIGEYTTSNSSYSGYIDELIVDNRAWSYQEVKKYYSQARGFF